MDDQPEAAAPQPYWQSPCGRVVLYHGDSLAVLQSLPSATVDAVITDPPYSSGGAFRGDRTAPTSTKYLSSDSERQSLPDFTGDNRDQRSFAYWCALWLSEARRVAKPGAPVVQFTDWRQLPTTTDAVQAGGWVWRGVGVWTKPLGGLGVRPVMGRFSSSAEFFVWGSNGPMPDREGVGCLPGAIHASTPRDERELHSTVKPVEVMSQVIQICPPEGAVLDPFAGSGSTLVASFKHGRRAIGIELHEQYAETAARRLQAMVDQGNLFGGTGT